MKIFLVIETSSEGDRIRCACNSLEKAKKIMEAFGEMNLSIKEIRVI